MAYTHVSLASQAISLADNCGTTRGQRHSVHRDLAIALYLKCWCSMVRVKLRLNTAHYALVIQLRVQLKVTMTVHICITYACICKPTRYIQVPRYVCGCMRRLLLISS